MRAPEGGALHYTYRPCREGDDVYCDGLANSMGHCKIPPSGLEPHGILFGPLVISPPIAPRTAGRINTEAPQIQSSSCGVLLICCATMQRSNKRIKGLKSILWSISLIKLGK